MHCVRTVTDNLYWVGANDHRLTLFENIHPHSPGGELQRLSSAGREVRAV